MGPLGCSISTSAGAVFNELKPRPGSSLAIFGAGNVGLSAVMAARLTGVTTIIAVDKEPERLALARELGATHVIEGGDDTIQKIKDLTHGALDYSIEVTDGSNLVADAVNALGILGACVMVGGASATAPVRLEHGDVMHEGKTLIGVMGGGGQSPEFHIALMELHREGRFPIDKLVKTYDFTDINQAIDDSDSGKTIKPILRMA